MKETPVNKSTKDEIEDSMREVKGSVKEKTGYVTYRPSLTAKDKTEKIAGKVQKEVGQLEEVLKKVNEHSAMELIGRILPLGRA